MRKTHLLSLLILVSAVSLCQGNIWENPGFETWNEAKNVPSKNVWRWGFPGKGLNQKAFEVFERSDKEKHGGTYSLHLKDNDKGKMNQALKYVIGTKEAQKYAGQVLHFSAWVKQVAASRAQSVGISLYVVAGGKSYSTAAYVDATGTTDWGQLRTKFKLPKDTSLIFASLLCCNGFYNTGEAYFDDIYLSTKEPLEPLARQPRAIEVKADTRIAPGGRMLSLYPPPPSWKVHVWSGFRYRDRVGTTPELRLSAPDGVKPYGGIHIHTQSLDRYYDIGKVSKDKLHLRFKLSCNVNLVIRCMDDGKQLGTPGGKAENDGRFSYSFKLSDFQLETNTFKGISIQFPEGVPKGVKLDVTDIGIYSDVATTLATVAPSPEAEAYRKSYLTDMVFTEDGWKRPEIRNGTWYMDGKPHLFLGMWVGRRRKFGWEINDNPLKIPHVAYNVGPGKLVWNIMEFNSAQISAAHTQPGQAMYGLPLAEDYKQYEADMTDYFNAFADIPMAMDFAFGFKDALAADNPILHKELDQRMGSWHSFIPYCPEHPDGDRYYQCYMLGGTKAALKNKSNIYIYELFNESAYGCQCRYNAVDFAQRMKVKYGTIAAANKVWGTIFSNFDDVARITNFQQYKQLWPDFAKFSAERYGEILKKYANVVRSVDKRKNVYFTEQSSGVPPENIGMDYRIVADSLDALTLEGGWRYGFNSKLTASNDMENVVVTGGSSHWFNCDFFQALAKGKKPILNNEHYCTRIENGIRVPSKKEDMITSLWMEILHGVSSNYTYVWDKRHWQWRTYEQAKANVIQPSYKSSSMLNPYNWPVSELDAFKIFRQELDPYLDRIMPFPRVKPATVAVFYSYPTMRMKPYYTWKFNARMTKWYATLLHAQYPVKVVFEEDLANLGPEVQALVIPAAEYATPESVKAVEQFRDRGGLVIAEEKAFRCNEYSAALPEVKGLVRLPVDRPEDMLPLLAKRQVVRYGTLSPADGGKTLSMTDLQLIDRGDFKLLFLVAMGELEPRLAHVSLNLSDKGEFYLYDIVSKRVMLNGTSETWTSEALRNGFDVVLPSQQRVVLTLERKRPEAAQGTLSQAQVKENHATLKASVADYVETFRAIERERQRKYKEDRIWTDVRPEKCHPVDLSGFVNMDFLDEIAGDKVGGWFDQGGNDFRNMPLGKRVFAGVPFTIVDPAKNNKKGVIVLYGTPRDYFPVAVKNIPVNKKAGKLYMLHTQGWDDKGKVMTYVVHYEDSSKLNVEIINGRDIQGWWGAKAGENAKIGVEVSNSQKDVVSMQVFRWVNPHPEKAIRSLDIVSAKVSAVPAIAAITVEEP